MKTRSRDGGTFRCTLISRRRQSPAWIRPLGAMTYLQKSLGSESMDEAFSAIQHSMEKERQEAAAGRRTIAQGKMCRRQLAGADVQILAGRDPEPQRPGSAAERAVSTQSPSKMAATRHERALPFRGRVHKHAKPPIRALRRPGASGGEEGSTLSELLSPAGVIRHASSLERPAR